MNVLCVLGFLAAVVSSTAALRCSMCNNAKTTSDCTTSVCATNEVCYIDEIITDTLQIVYHGGCRSPQACPVTKSGRSDILACSQCCHQADMCNSQLCGIKHPLTPPTPTAHVASNLTCRRCDLASSLADCTSITCFQDEICYMEELVTDQLKIIFNGGCKSKLRCKPNAPVGRRDDLTACLTCCDSNDCNDRLCGIPAVTTPPPSGLTTRAVKTCFRCQQARFLAECTKAYCTQDEMCYMEQLITDDLSVKYDAGCRANSVCTRVSGGSVIGKRVTLVTCSLCCTGNGCNGRLCKIN